MDHFHNHILSAVLEYSWYVFLDPQNFKKYELLEVYKNNI